MTETKNLQTLRQHAQEAVHTLMHAAYDRLKEEDEVSRKKIQELHTQILELKKAALPPQMSSGPPGLKGHSREALAEELMRRLYGPDPQTWADSRVAHEDSRGRTVYVRMEPVKAPANPLAEALHPLWNKMMKEPVLAPEPVPAKHQKRWTDDDEALLVRMYRRGYGLSCIARALGRYEDAVLARIFKLSGSDSFGGGFHDTPEWYAHAKEHYFVHFNVPGATALLRRHSSYGMPPHIKTAIDGTPVNRTL